MSPGDVIVWRGNRRLVLSVTRSIVCLEKIGRSWTDPNPMACYDAYLFKNATVVLPATRYRADKAKRLRSWKNPEALIRGRR